MAFSISGRNYFGGLRMIHFLTPSATSVTMRHSSPSASTACAGTGLTHFSFAHTCKNFVASRRASSEVDLRLRAIFKSDGVVVTARDMGNAARSRSRNVALTAAVVTPSRNNAIGCLRRRANHKSKNSSTHRRNLQHACNPGAC